MQMIALDAHKHYTLASVNDEKGRILKEERIEHKRGNIKQFLDQCEVGSQVALEAIGSWYWIVDEIEAAGFIPRLVHPRKAKLMLGMINKTDKLDVRGLNRLQQVNTLPTVWIPPASLRDKRELCRSRLVLTRMRTRLKCRIHSIMEKYGFQDELKQLSDLFGKRGRKVLKRVSLSLPDNTYISSNILLEILDFIESKIGQLQEEIKEVFCADQTIKLLMSAPGIGFILATTISLELGDINRFPSSEHFAAYCGLVPCIHSSGGKVRFGPLRSDCNHYLKWAYSEAANCIALNYKRRPYWHVSKLYKRLRQRRNHAIAIGAVARHLAESSYWMLTKGQPYRDRGLKGVRFTKA